MLPNNKSKINHALWDNSEFDSWANKEDLIVEEKYCFDKYLFSQDKSANILDIGTGNGRFIFELAKKGYKNLNGIDLSERLLSIARERSKKSYPFLKFDKMSVSELTFNSNLFDIVIALQQVICFVENESERLKAFDECYRVLNNGGMFVASILIYEGRKFNSLISPFTFPIKIIKQDRNYLKNQYLPWLKLGNNINYKYLFKKQPYVYWFKTSEVLRILEKVGFKILDKRTSKMILENTDELRKGGMLYIIAQK